MNQSSGERQTMIALGRGLFVLRYASCDHPHAPPRVRFGVAGGAQPGIRIVPMPGSPAGELNNVGELAVIAADVPGALDVLVSESRPGGGVGCSVALDRLGTSAPASSSDFAPSSYNTAPAITVASATQYNSAPAAQAVLPSPVPAAPTQKMLAHLSNRGDVAVVLGDWIGGPLAPTPIEGFAIPVGMVDGVALEYQVLPVGADAWGAWSPPGAFVGSRGQRRPLRGVRLRVAASAGYQVRGEALFLGAPIDQKIGRAIEFMSSSPFDAMVGLRIELVHDAAREVAPISFAALPAEPNRLKVFRSSRVS